MRLRTAFVALILLSNGAVVFARSMPELSTQDEVNAGIALVASFRKSEGYGETAEISAIERYLQAVGEKVAQHAQHKLPYTFHLSPHPGFRSAVAYPGGQILVGAGVLALMEHEDELAVVLGHEIAHIDLNQCSGRLVQVMQRDHLTSADFGKLSVEDFGKPYGKEGELAADREGLQLAVAAGYSPQGAIELLEVYQFLNRNAKPSPPRPDSPAIEERIHQASDEIKSQGWDANKPEKPLDLP